MFEDLAFSFIFPVWRLRLLPVGSRFIINCLVNLREEEKVNRSQTGKMRLRKKMPRLEAGCVFIKENTSL